jgi:hypothetical protein
VASLHLEDGRQTFPYRIREEQRVIQKLAAIDYRKALSILSWGTSHVVYCLEIGRSFLLRLHGTGIRYRFRCTVSRVKA